VDEESYQGGNMGKDHPIAWCRNMGKGRIWYTALGHTEESFSEALFLEHLLGGIQVAAGVKKADFSRP
jgi:type 1 glutamine amidotransferase